MTTLDPRILRPGMAISLETLVAVYADHYRRTSTMLVCPGCGYRFRTTDINVGCPTLAVVRPLLRLRRNENPMALSRLTPAQLDDLNHSTRATRTTPRHRAARPEPTPELFDPASYRRTTGLR